MFSTIEQPSLSSCPEGLRFFVSTCSLGSSESSLSPPAAPLRLKVLNLSSFPHTLAVAVQGLLHDQLLNSTRKNTC